MSTKTETWGGLTRLPDGSLAAAALKEGQQAYRASLRLNNGEPAQLALYIQRILRTQDLVAWQGDLPGFNRWLKGAICDYVNRCEAVIKPIPQPNEAAFVVTMVKGGE